MPLVAIIAVGAWLIIRSTTSHGGTQATAQTVPVTKGTMAQTISASGTVAAAQTDDLSFSSGGTVTAVDVVAGAKVHKGEVLASIDSASLQAAVASAESSLASAQSQLSNDQSTGASSDQLAADQASLTTAQDSLDQATADLQGANLVATFDGTVSTVDLTVGERLSSSGTGGTSTTGTASGSGRSASRLGSGANTGGFSPAGSSGNGSSGTSGTSTPQITVISDGSYTVTLNVAASDVTHLATGQTATVALSTAVSSDTRRAQFLAAFGGGRSNSSGGSTATTLPADVSGTQATGTVTSVGAVADASSGVATYPVVVSFSGSPSTFQPGATVNATITDARIPNAIQVPTRAVTTTDMGSTVNVETDGHTHEVTVTLGATWNGMSQVTGGLRVGQLVVLPSFTFAGRPNGENGSPSNLPGADIGGGGFRTGGSGQGGFGQGGR